MEAQEVTYYVKLIAEHCDSMGYINYVFERLDTNNEDEKYIMCVRFPNWNQDAMNLNDVGFVNLRYVKAGVDKWFDGTQFIAYRYTNIIFLKFIKKRGNIKINEIVTD